MTQLSATQVAKMVGVSKRTIQNKITKGTLSATRDVNNNYIIDLSEVLRVYPSANCRANSDFIENECREKINSNSENIIKLETENKLLKEQVLMLKEQILIIKDQLNKSEDREKKLLDTVSTTTKLIEHDKAKKKRFLGIF